MTTHTLPFGKHKGASLPDVPTPYLSWLARDAKLSSGLAGAVRDELTRRGVTAPKPPPRPPRRCHQCGGTELRAVWLRQSDNRRAIRGTCARCGSWVGALPLTPENVALADAGSDPSALLTFLIALDAAGVSVRLEGGRLLFDPRDRMTRELFDLERQCRGQLHAMLTPEPSTPGGTIR
jgi:hypothetical protein